MRASLVRSVLLTFVVVPAFAVTLQSCAWTQQAVLDAASPYLDADTLDLGRVLPPPPADDSEITRREIEQMLSIQAARTPEQAARASADVEASIFRFADAIGNAAAFNEKSLPKTTWLFRKVLLEHAAVVQAGKRSFSRPRPFELDSRIEPVIDRPHGDSYPSGHTMWGRTAGLLLADMLPEYRAKIMARADEYGFNRVIAGVHYPSDVEAGKQAGTAFVATLLASPRFQQDFMEAKRELRETLGLPERS